MSNPLLELRNLGQSLWYDNLRRGLVTSGELQAMVREDGLAGVTSNPAIFEKAVAGSSDYDPAIKALVAQDVGDAKQLFEQLAVGDIQLAADVLHPVYLDTEGRDGFVSLEVSPYLAHDTEATVEEARRLHRAVGRDNLLIKVPATPEGIPAIRQLVGEGISVNVTLLFAIDAYEAAADAYTSGLEDLVSRGGDPSRLASVASFFLSRIDSLIDERVSQELDATREPARRAKLKKLMGRVAIANARLAYARYQELVAAERWKKLAARGARPQRLLWASTSTKNPKYRKTLYVEELIGPDTVNTVPTETFQAFKQEGRPRAALTEGWAETLEEARETLRILAEVGISMKEVTDQLLTRGVQLFSDAFDKLLGALEAKRQALLGGELARQSVRPGAAEEALRAALEQWRAEGRVRRLWAGDASLWSGADEGRWLGWLHAVDGWGEHLEHLEAIVADARDAGLRDAVVLGMGGSSLCPDVMSRTFGSAEGHPSLHVLDSTVPAQVRAIEQRIDLERTLFIVSSKSGGTIEPNVFKRYFFEKLERALGAGRAGEHFAAITDPGTALHEMAKADRFRSIAHGEPSIGGRFSALSNFGMVPAAIAGLDVRAFLDRAEVMVQSCASVVPPEQNPGVSLGLALGTLARQGRDKLTLFASPQIAGLGAWLEQLIAESTGKRGVGIVPVDGERPGPPEVYGDDRVFAYLRLGAQAGELDAAVDALEAAGHPVVRIVLGDAMDLGQEFFRWEIATAVAGSVLGINAFDQPDVEAAKVAARRLTAAYEQSGRLPEEAPVLEEDGLRVFADPANAEATGAGRGARLERVLSAHLARLGPGDYFAINAFVEMNGENDAALQGLRHAVRDARRVATTLGYGPRFLHSTGQLHKGGPPSGVFLQITGEDAEDLPVPGQGFSFGALAAAQARGDFEVLADRGRRLLRVHLGPDPAAGLARLREIAQRAL